MKIVLFDVDETLLSCGKKANDKCSEMMFKRVFNINASEDDINHEGKTAKAIIEEVLRLHKNLNPNQQIEIPNLAYQVWGESLGQLSKDYPPQVLPGIKDLLTLLSQDQNIVVGLLTGNSRFQAQVKLKATNLEHFFLNPQGILRGV